MGAGLKGVTSVGAAVEEELINEGAPARGAEGLPEEGTAVVPAAAGSEGTAGGAEALCAGFVPLAASGTTGATGVVVGALFP